MAETTRVGVGGHRAEKYSMTQVEDIQVVGNYANRFFSVGNWLFWELILKIIWTAEKD